MMIENEPGLALKEKLTSDCGMLIVDLDDTIKEPAKITWPDGVGRKVYPETVSAFKLLHENGIRIGIATEQSFSEIEPFIKEVAGLVGIGNPYALFNGIVVGEGGSVIRRQETGEQVVIASNQTQVERILILDWLSNNIRPISSDNEWGLLEGLDVDSSTLVALPSPGAQGIATLSLWEKGPRISENPDYIPRYAMVAQRVDDAMKSLGITTLRTYEAGNGTLRIVPNNIDKFQTLRVLSALGYYNPEETIYACDGPNDVKLAGFLKSKDGGVIAVANAVPELHGIANYSSQNVSGLGFAEAITIIFPNENVK